MKILNKEYKKYELIDSLWKNGLFSALFVLLIFILFQPFGFRDKDLELKLTLFPLYALFGLFYKICTSKIILYILKIKGNWTFKDELLYLAISMIPLTFLIHILTWWVTDDMPLNLYWYFRLLYHVSSLYLIIVVIEILYYNNKSSRFRLEHLSSQIQIVAGQLEKHNQETAKETVSISLEKELFDINRHKIVFIKSIGNYLEFYLREPNGQFKKFVKRGRIHQAEKDLETFPEFLRCHRAFIVNLKQAKQIKGTSKHSRLFFDHNLEEIPVSRSLFKTLKVQLDKIIAG